jgi:hypothetical protein
MNNSIRAFQNTMVEICIMPTINPQSYPFNPNGMKQVQGLILKEWAHHSDHVDNLLQYLDILVNGKVIRYWRPLVSKKIALLQQRTQALDNNFWEISGERSPGGPSYIIRPIQKIEW